MLLKHFCLINWEFLFATQFSGHSIPRRWKSKRIRWKWIWRSDIIFELVSIYSWNKAQEKISLKYFLITPSIFTEPKYPKMKGAKCSETLSKGPNLWVEICIISLRNPVQAQRASRQSFGTRKKFQISIGNNVKFPRRPKDTV